MSVAYFFSAATKRWISNKYEYVWVPEDVSEFPVSPRLDALMLLASFPSHFY